MKIQKQRFIGNGGNYGHNITLVPIITNLDFGQNERVLGQKTRERENAKTGQRKELDIVLLPACGIPPRAGGTFDAMSPCTPLKRGVGGWIVLTPRLRGWGYDFHSVGVKTNPRPRKRGENH